MLHKNTNTDDSKSTGILDDVEKCIREKRFQDAKQSLLKFSRILQKVEQPLNIPEPIKKFLSIECYFTLYQVYLKCRRVDDANLVLRNLYNYLYSKYFTWISSDQVLSEALFSMASYKNFQTEHSIYFVKFLEYSIKTAEDQIFCSQVLLTLYCHYATLLLMDENNVNNVFNQLKVKLDEKLITLEKKASIANMVRDHAKKLSSMGKHKYANQLHILSVEVNLDLANHLVLQQEFSKNLSSIREYINTALRYSENLEKFSSSLSKSFMQLGYNARYYGKNDKASNEIFLLAKAIFIKVSEKSFDPHECITACIDTFRCITEKNSNDEELLRTVDQIKALTKKIIKNKITISDSTCNQLAKCVERFSKNGKHNIAEDLTLCYEILINKNKSDEEIQNFQKTISELTQTVSQQKIVIEEQQEKIKALEEKCVQSLGRESSCPPTADIMDQESTCPPTVDIMDREEKLSSIYSKARSLTVFSNPTTQNENKKRKMEYPTQPDPHQFHRKIQENKF